MEVNGGVIYSILFQLHVSKDDWKDVYEINFLIENLWTMNEDSRFALSKNFWLFHPLLSPPSLLSPPFLPSFSVSFGNEVLLCYAMLFYAMLETSWTLGLKGSSHLGLWLLGHKIPKNLGRLGGGSAGEGLATQSLGPEFRNPKPMYMPSGNGGPPGISALQGWGRGTQKQTR